MVSPDSVSVSAHDLEDACRVEEEEGEDEEDP